jgi:hypothetical protein
MKEQKKAHIVCSKIAGTSLLFERVNKESGKKLII